MLSSDLPELVVRSAVISDRAAARNQHIGLTVVDGTVSSVRLDGRVEALCSGIRRAAWAPATVLPQEIGVVTAVGAVVLMGDDTMNVFPLDVWWIEPAAPATPRQAVASSGFDDLAARLGLEIAFDPDAMTDFSAGDHEVTMTNTPHGGAHRIVTRFRGVERRWARGAGSTQVQWVRPITDSPRDVAITLSTVIPRSIDEPLVLPLVDDFALSIVTA